MSFWQKSALGAARSKPCRHCGANLSVPPSSTMVVVSPMLFLILFGQLWWLPKLRDAGFTTSYLIATVLGVIGLSALCLYLQHRTELIEK